MNPQEYIKLKVLRHKLTNLRNNHYDREACRLIVAHLLLDYIGDREVKLLFDDIEKWHNRKIIKTDAT